MWVFREMHDKTGATIGWGVGFFAPADCLRTKFDGAATWEQPITVATKAEAKLWVHYLNGGEAPKGLEPE